MAPTTFDAGQNQAFASNPRCCACALLLGWCSRRFAGALSHRACALICSHDACPCHLCLFTQQNDWILDVSHRKRRAGLLSCSDRTHDDLPCVLEDQRTLMPLHLQGRALQPKKPHMKLYKAITTSLGISRGLHLLLLMSSNVNGPNEGHIQGTFVLVQIFVSTLKEQAAKFPF